jgi:hypothetical protein
MTLYVSPKSIFPNLYKDGDQNESQTDSSPGLCIQFGALPETVTCSKGAQRLVCPGSVDLCTDQHRRCRLLPKQICHSCSKPEDKYVRPLLSRGSCSSSKCQVNKTSDNDRCDEENYSTEFETCPVVRTATQGRGCGS